MRPTNFAPASTPRRTRTAAFTLIELLVVIAIIAILAAILFPVFAQAREKARAISCLSNQKQIGLAFMMYVQDYDETFPNVGWWDSYDTSNKWLGSYSWPLAIIPYHKNTGKSSFLKCPSDSDHPNFSKPEYIEQLIAMKWPGAVAGMTTEQMAQVFPLSYAANYALSASGSATPAKGGLALAALSAPASVFLTSEFGRGTAPWTNSQYSVYYTFPGYPNPYTRWKAGQRHQGGRNFTFTDGHAKFIKEPVSLDTPGQYTQDQVTGRYCRNGIYTRPDEDGTCPYPK